ncbi:MAG TPA: DMT family transporter [Ktedonobacteraceae bacterium]|nr:DMT family transporter [Ktedonobacteraceae bacterium]
MPLAALALLLVAALLHTGWNLFIKRAREKLVFTWWALLLAAVCFAPFLLQVRTFPATVWPYVLSSALMEAIYFLVLIGAYRFGDFSLVYPMARGAAPALLALWAALFLGERPDLAGTLGIVLLIGGLVVVGGTTWWQQRKTSSIAGQALGLALATACCVSIYSAIDGAAVRMVEPAGYTVLVVGLSGVLITPLVLVRYGGKTLLSELRGNWWRILLAGMLSLLTYMLVLLAFSFSSVSYSGAIREISVVFAAFIGWRWLGEGFGRARLLGSLLIFAGILVIALAG